MKISKSELTVLEILWTEHPLTVGQVIERLQQSTSWHENTIKTLLTRLIQKEALGRYKDGRRFFYKPLITRDAHLTQASEGFLEQFFNGEMAPLVAHFAERKKLSAEDIQEIETILNTLKESKDD